MADCCKIVSKADSYVSANTLKGRSEKPTGNFVPWRSAFCHNHLPEVFVLLE